MWQLVIPNMPFGFQKRALAIPVLTLSAWRDLKELMVLGASWVVLVKLVALRMNASIPELPELSVPERQRGGEGKMAKVMKVILNILLFAPRWIKDCIEEFADWAECASDSWELFCRKG